MGGLGGWGRNQLKGGMKELSGNGYICQNSSTKHLRLHILLHIHLSLNKTGIK